MLEVPEGWNPLDAVRRDLCQIFGIEFIYTYQERPFRLCFAMDYTQIDEPKEAMYNQWVHPAPVGELMNHFFEMDMNKAFAAGQKNGYAKAYYQTKRWYLPWNWGHHEPQPNGAMYRMTIKFPVEKYERWCGDKPDIIRAQVEALHSDALSLRYEQGFMSGARQGAYDATGNKPPEFD